LNTAQWGVKTPVEFLSSQAFHSPMPVCKPKNWPQCSRFGRNLAVLREHRKLTREKLAEKVGTSTRYIQRLEAGEYFPGLPTLAQIKIALACSCEDLLAGCVRA
jgi:DNA-binding XRE family transcriptional regulator